MLATFKARSIEFIVFFISHIPNVLRSKKITDGNLLWFTLNSLATAATTSMVPR